MKYIKINLLNILILITFDHGLNSMKERAQQEQPGTYLETLPYELRNRIEAKFKHEINRQMDEAIEKAGETNEQSYEAKVKDLFVKYGPRMFSTETILKAANQYRKTDEQKNYAIFSILDFLVGSDIDITKRDAQGETLLLKLLKLGITGFPSLDEVFKKIKAMPEQERKAYINAKSTEGMTALMYPTSDYSSEKMIKLGADVNLKDNEGKTALHFIDDIKILKILLAQPEIKINETDNRERTALTDAVIGNKYDKVKLLLERGADPNIRDKGGKKGRTALYYAEWSFTEEAEITKLLLKSGARK